MKTLGKLVKRNVKLFFKDKGLFFTSLITPLIILVLFVSFLGKVYYNTFEEILSGFNVEKRILSGLVGGELISSLLAVCGITIAFCSNMLMVNDKVTGAIDDILITPVKKSTLALSYYISTFISTIIICMIGLVVALIYIAISGGWCFSFVDILNMIIDVVIIVLFGTSLSTFVNYFLNSQGQISAVGTIVSSMYGFICGAYMPINSFSKVLQNIITFLPGTYGTTLLRTHSLNGTFRYLNEKAIPSEAIDGIKDAIDCNLYFFDHQVPNWVKYVVMIVSTLIIVLAYILIMSKHKARKK